MGICGKCGKEDYALHITGGEYKFLCRDCYCMLYRDCVNECCSMKCPNRKDKGDEYGEKRMGLFRRKNPDRIL